VGGYGSGGRPRWSPAGSSVAYTPAEVSALTPVREAVEKLVLVPERWDIFLCHAWDDRAGAAKELHDLLVSRGVKVWFSEKDVALGTPFLPGLHVFLDRLEAQLDGCPLPDWMPRFNELRVEYPEWTGHAPAPGK
jgi:hypothetical protein